MASLKSEEAHTIIRKDILFEKGSSNKKYKPEKINEITSVVCALLNSGGGRLELHCSEKDTKKMSECQKVIEQRVIEMIGITAMRKLIKNHVSEKEIIFNVKASHELITMNYNLYLPTQSQVNVVTATTPISDIKEILFQTIVDGCVSNEPNRSHKKRFQKDSESGLQEGDTVQLKMLKDTPTKNVTLADRIAGKSNKFECYVSAFANHRGGHIYYGISDEEIVTGQNVDEEEKYNIEKKVEKAIKKMIWPQQVKPEKGKEWDIFFEPVVETDNNPVPSLYIIVIYIAFCPGGVFPEQPESYYFDKSKVTKMSFEKWWEELTGIPMQKFVPRLQWSSPKNKAISRNLTSYLVKHRNNHEIKHFQKCVNWAKSTYPDGSINIELIILGEEIIQANKRREFEVSEDLLKTFENNLLSSPDSGIFQVKLLNLKGMMERIKGNYDQSYRTTQECLQAADSVSDELNTALAYQEAGLITSISTRNCLENRKQKQQALDYLNYAKEQIAILQNEFDLNYAKEHIVILPNEFKQSHISDLQQRLRLYRVSVLLGCCVADREIQQKTTSANDIKLAEETLTCINECASNGEQLTYFRQIEYKLAMSDLRSIQSEASVKERKHCLKEALAFAEEAKRLAIENNFLNSICYADKRIQELQ